VILLDKKNPLHKTLILATSAHFSSLCAAFLERLCGLPVTSEEAEEGFEFESQGLRAH
jgi:hypothetical protein